MVEVPMKSPIREPTISDDEKNKLSNDLFDELRLNLSKDSTAYTKKDCYELLKRIYEGNKATCGLKLVTLCYRIIGFIKFLGPYYMLVITERREIGEICGHRVYEVSKSEIISLRISSVLCNIANSSDENRYKRLMCMVDLTKDFFMMRSFLKNICDHESGGALYKKIQVFLKLDGHFKLTPIARRSRHNAGTSKLQLETEKFQLESVLDTIISQVMIMLSERKSQLRVEVAPEIKTLPLYGDRVKLQLILADLLRNIVNHAHFQIVGMIHPGKRIPSEILSDMFETRDGWVTPDGLGLKLSWKLLEQMNGSVSYVREDERCFFQVDLQVKTRLGVETRVT
ncbi:hypothetical protein YC2023_083032 [Brassica napus]|uniref:(rape) hypothetical protein n=1 Tax=Brassica napus TaxID=3708 RepID=A0A816LYX7_BRANA|nr:unnamed protein product [Brassica napus]